MEETGGDSGNPFPNPTPSPRKLGSRRRKRKKWRRRSQTPCTNWSCTLAALP